MSRIRCFVGIPLAPCIADPAIAASEMIREQDRSWRDEKWVARENLHITLKFLGTLDEAQAMALAEAVGDTIEAYGAFALPLQGLRAVPQARRCRMLWLSFLDPDGACASLAEGIDRVALGFGIAPEERAYAPHATLCRARRSRPVSERAIEAAGALLSEAPSAMSVPSATVFSSRLTPRGPIYTPIGSRSLRGN